MNSQVYNPNIAHLAPNNADLPDSYKSGVSVMDARTENGFPQQGQLVTERNLNAGYTNQRLTSITTSNFTEYKRSAFYNGASRVWTPWVKSATGINRDSQPQASDLPDTYPDGLTLDDARTTNGFLAQGQLRTTRNVTGGYTYQELISATSPVNLVYRRASYYDGTSRVWTDWYVNGVIRDKQVLASDLPDSYPAGETVDDARTANGFPQQGPLKTVRSPATNYCMQTLTSITSEYFLQYQRTAYYNGSTRVWTPWYIAGSLRVSVTFDPPSISAGAYATTTATITGIPAGKMVQAAFSINITADIVLTAWVSGPNTVTGRFHNIGSAPVDLPSGTLYFFADI
ncbi:hypothetical protein [Dyadobacter fermentans]|uniref:hypothetical protein n=1 Tax=Dyadobacter fermentans TaxID=94254 RepID=UPI00118080DE|nr:hypothetical protein [Dyadobacter fermentans]